MTVIRKEDGSVRKENPEVTARLESDLIRFRTAINRAEIMSALKDHPGWIAIQEILNEKIEAIDKKLSNFKSNEHRVNDLLMQERLNFKFFVTIVEDFTGSISGFEQKVDQIEKALSERRKQATPV